MSDFDKFFKEKLEEETQFPRRDRNWRALSKQLDAFNVGLQEQGAAFRTHLRYWQAAAGFAIAAASFLTWKVVATQSENAELRREVAVLQEKNKAATSEIARIEMPSPISSEQSGKDSPSRSFEEKENFSNSNKTFAYRNNLHLNAVAAPSANILKTTGYEEKTPTSEQIAGADSAQTQTADFANIQKWQNLELLPADALQEVILTSKSKTAPNVPPLPDVAAASKIIEPVRPPSRFRAGVQFSTGFPQPSEEGISPLMGPGVTAEYNLWRDLWLTASADWLRFDISTTEYFPKFYPHHHFPDPPHHGGGGSPPKELVQVESAQRQQQFGLGLRYALPVHFWVRPSVRGAYSWTHVSPELISFKFEESPHGGPHGNPDPHPEYIVQKTESQQFGNVWRFGAGLEHETQRLAFGLWADYSKNFAATDLTFDALLFRAGVQYKF